MIRISQKVRIFLKIALFCSDNHEEVLKNGDTETGCTIHFVTEEVDGGPILIQKSCSVEKDDTIESLKTKVQSLEGQAFIEAINLITNK